MIKQTKLLYFLQESSSDDSVESVKQIKISGSGNAASSVQSLGLSVGISESKSEVSLRCIVICIK